MPNTRVYKAPECDEAGVPLDWKRCRTCKGEGRVRDESFAAADAEFGWDHCLTCDGHGSLEAAALDALRRWEPIGDDVTTQHRVARCEGCGHKMSEGTWEGGGASGGATPMAQEFLSAAERAMRAGVDVSPATFQPQHYSPCDEGCRHGGPGKGSPNLSLRGELVGRVLQKAGAYGIKPMPRYEASWRSVAVRVGAEAFDSGLDHSDPLVVRPFDLRPENLAVLCLRCYAEKTHV